MQFLINQIKGAEILVKGGKIIIEKHLEEFEILELEVKKYKLKSALGQRQVLLPIRNKTTWTNNHSSEDIPLIAIQEWAVSIRKL